MREIDIKPGRNLYLLTTHHNEHHEREIGCHKYRTNEGYCESGVPGAGCPFRAFLAVRQEELPECSRAGGCTCAFHPELCEFEEDEEVGAEDDHHGEKENLKCVVITLRRSKINYAIYRKYSSCNYFVKVEYLTITLRRSNITLRRSNITLRRSNITLRRSTTHQESHNVVEHLVVRVHEVVGRAAESRRLVNGVVVTYAKHEENGVRYTTNPEGGDKVNLL